MASLPIDRTFARQAPYTPKPNIRVVFLPGPAQTAMAGELAKLPAETQEATLEELEIAGLAEEMIAAAEQLLSRPMYAAFLNWTEAAVRFNTRFDSDEEGNKLCAANDAAAMTLADVPSANIHDVLLKTRLLAIDAAELPDFGSMIPDQDPELYSSRLFSTVSQDFGTVSPVMAAFNRLGMLAWRLSDRGLGAIAPSIGRVIVNALQAAQERNAASAAAGLPLRNLLLVRNAVADKLNTDISLDENAVGAACAEADRLETAIATSAATTADDAVIKLIALAQITATGREVDDTEAAQAIIEARKHFGIGYAPDNLTVEIAADARRFGDHGAYLQSDKLLLDTFAKMQREMQLWFDQGPGTPEEDAAADARASALEDVLFAQRANTIEGVIAKLRETFRHLDGNAWSDHATLDPDHPEFQRGVKNTGFFTRALWHSIEDLARIGGVSLTEVRA
ncbi:hypothetical protein SOM26_04105 [Sphingomonas sp. CFBP8993]|uniref:hypothetical protein n=1 Tax=Sphingomonas sp. CFBP8993 TaxID=3096526 RepID=UPI002A69ACE7|nr:hypothetical protein [Sphingomonas sp. CFBP8993]MDY0957863.1 hypothetical protein [Sphingomonas sp. CFBP8993]